MVNYCPVSYVLICGKAFEKSLYLIYFLSFFFFFKKKLVSLNGSVFYPKDSCEDQRLSIFTQYLLVHSLLAKFLDISKALAKFELLRPFQSFLSNGLQRVALDDQSTTWSSFLAWISQDPIHGRLLLSVYINCIRNNLESLAKVFADFSSFLSALTFFYLRQRL